MALGLHETHARTGDTTHTHTHTHTHHTSAQAAATLVSAAVMTAALLRAHSALMGALGRRLTAAVYYRLWARHHAGCCDVDTFVSATDAVHTVCGTYTPSRPLALWLKLPSLSRERFCTEIPARRLKPLRQSRARLL
jgi:hypothetical protein